MLKRFEISLRLTVSVLLIEQDISLFDHVTCNFNRLIFAKMRKLNLTKVCCKYFWLCAIFNVCLFSSRIGTNKQFSSFSINLYLRTSGCSVNGKLVWRKVRNAWLCSLIPAIDDCSSACEGYAILLEACDDSFYWESQKHLSKFLSTNFVVAS